MAQGRTFIKQQFGVIIAGKILSHLFRLFFIFVVGGIKANGFLAKQHPACPSIFHICRKGVEQGGVGTSLGQYAFHAHSSMFSLPLSLILLILSLPLPLSHTSLSLFLSLSFFISFSLSFFISLSTHLSLLHLSFFLLSLSLFSQILYPHRHCIVSAAHTYSTRPFLGRKSVRVSRWN